MFVLGIVKSLTGEKKLRNKILIYKTETSTLNLIGNWHIWGKNGYPICSL